ncbi:Uncharacterised protein [Klebsiella pneumoniae]|nr:Uncharacterised protein [Klebsiella pneumoniae]
MHKIFHNQPLSLRENIILDAVGQGVIDADFGLFYSPPLQFLQDRSLPPDFPDKTVGIAHAGHVAGGDKLGIRHRFAAAGGGDKAPCFFVPERMMLTGSSLDFAFKVPDFYLIQPEPDFYLIQTYPPLS